MNTSPQSINVIILGDERVGLRVANWLAARGEKRVILGTRGDRQDLRPSLPHPSVDYLGPLSREKSERVARDLAEPGSILVTCYWPWLLSPDSFLPYEGRTVNFHPAYLPRDRGWYPHVHQIKEGRPAGVTLHQLASEPDAGDIWSQEVVSLPFPLTSHQARILLAEHITSLFRKTWPGIRSGSLAPEPQSGRGTFWRKSDVDKLNILDRNEVLSTEELLRWLACRNSSKRSFVAIDGDHGQRFVHIAFSRNGVWPEEEQDLPAVGHAEDGSEHHRRASDSPAGDQA